MKIIKKREAHIEVFEEKCDNCKSELEYTQEDVHIDYNVYSKGGYVTCPVCGNEMRHYDAEDYTEVPPI
jgi:C4-type Zn-finger protein